METLSQILIKTDNDFQDKNDAMAVFCGGIVEDGYGGENYRFDPVGTKYLMKCPPFGIIPRTNESGQRIMQYHQNYNHLMAVVKECYAKALENPLLEEFLTEIKEVLVMGNIQITHSAVYSFIEQYNLTPSHP